MKVQDLFGWIVYKAWPSQIAALKLFWMQNFEETVTKAVSPGLLVFTGAWPFFLSEHKHLKVTYISVLTQEWDVGVYKSAKDFFFMFEQVKGICQLHKSELYDKAVIFVSIHAVWGDGMQ